MVEGYRRPKNLRDTLVHSGIPRLPGDELVDPNYIEPVVLPHTSTSLTSLNPVPKKTIIRQSSITDFFQNRPGPSNPDAQTLTPTREGGSKYNKRLGTNPANRGFKFCQKTNCRYCLKINFTGSITSKTTGEVFQCKKNISCRSSNLIYGITCNRCGTQYVGQTKKRLKDRFVKHFLQIEKAQIEHTCARHFSQTGHNVVYDMKISVLEFIRKAPESEAAKIIRDRVERRWMHLLRTCAPQDLNIED